MRIREIQETDLSAVLQLLIVGFPKKTPVYWAHVLSVLAARPRCGGLPVFGLALEIEGALQGLMLMISGQKNGDRFCNLSSWYVRPEYRKFSPFLFQRALRPKDVSFTDCSPAPHVLPIITKFGFCPYSCGTLLIDPRASLRSSAPIRNIRTTLPEQIAPDLRITIESHLSYGCRGFLIEGQRQCPMPVLYRTTRLKRAVPSARIVYGDPDIIIANAGGLMRKLMRRGIMLMLIDLPCGSNPTLGRIFPEYEVRYVRGPNIPDVGDLLDTEVSVFGL